jgi:asparagine synthase (glutamine-hydrolysing)
MCGISGILQFENHVNRDLFKEMTKIISYRGPDDEGYLFGNMNSGKWISAGDKDTPESVYKSHLPYVPSVHLNDITSEIYNLALSNRRLAILDLSSAGHQPMSNDDKSIWIVHNGEIYNYREIRRELEAKGYSFTSDSDTEVIIKAYEQWKSGCLEKFNGMWAFCIWDIREKLLFCARDRFGIKPFYFFYDERYFAFGSEIKILLQMDIVRKPNDKLIYDFLKCGVLDHTAETLFEGINKLPQSHYMIIDLNGNLTVKKYWDVEVSNEIFDEHDKTKYAEEFLDVFTDAVKLRLRSDVAIGSCLSGGLDSSSIVCVANKLMFPNSNLLAHERQISFSSCFEYRRYDEREYIEEVIKNTHSERNFVFPQPEGFIEELDNVLWHQEEPFSGPSIYAQWCLMRKARQRGVTVMLDGQGADEQLAGYRKFIIFYLLELKKNKNYLNLCKEFINFFSSYDVIKTLNVIRGLRYFNIGNRIMGIDDLLIDSFKNKCKGREIHIGYQGNLGKRMKEDLFKYSLPVMLRYEDKNSMAHSVEARLPFLDYRVVEKLASFPLTQKIRNGWTKYVLRNAMRDTLPNKILLRKSKLGFVTPEDIWFKKNINEIIMNVFDKPVFISNYVYKEKLASYFKKYLENKYFYSSSIFFRYFILEIWGKKFRLS